MSAGWRNWHYSVPARPASSGSRGTGYGGVAWPYKSLTGVAHSPNADPERAKSVKIPFVGRMALPLRRQFSDNGKPALTYGFGRADAERGGRKEVPLTQNRAI
ncbi:MAG: hypothetical protein AAF557_23985 [Pseudomonadota bacterium]